MAMAAMEVLPLVDPQLHQHPLDMELPLPLFVQQSMKTSARL